jgi:hypothetical protein
VATQKVDEVVKVLATLEKLNSEPKSIADEDKQESKKSLADDTYADPSLLTQGN